MLPAPALDRGVQVWLYMFDEPGQSYAVVPAASYDHCLVVCLDLDSGQPLAAKPIRAEPEGIFPVHHHGWLGWPVRRRRLGAGPGLVGPVSGPAIRAS